MKMYAMRDRKSGKFVADGYLDGESLEEMYNAGEIFFFKPEQLQKHMNRIYGLDVEIVEFTRTVKYEEVK